MTTFQPIHSVALFKCTIFIESIFLSLGKVNKNMVYLIVKRGPLSLSLFHMDCIAKDHTTQNILGTTKVKKKKKKKEREITCSKLGMIITYLKITDSVFNSVLGSKVGLFLTGIFLIAPFVLYIHPSFQLLIFMFLCYFVFLIE